MHMTVLDTFLIILLIALIIAVVFRRLQLSVTLGYLLVGVLVGPHALKLLPNLNEIKTLSEFGIVLLMFTVGLEFSIPKLKLLRRSVFYVGFLQVFLSITITTGIALALQISLIPAIVIGCILSMSSTTIVMKQLTDQKALHTPHGQHTVGILLFQDLAVIPIFILLAMIATPGSPGSAWIDLMLALAKGAIAVALILVIGRWLLSPAIHLIAKTQQIEIFTLAVLFISVGAAWLTHRLGLSYALGAFIAGMMLAECEHKHTIREEIRPFRDILLGLFFVSIGLMVNINQFPKIWPWVILMVTGFMIGKFALIYVLSRLFKFDRTQAAQCAIILAGGGEFGCAILTIALTHHLIPATWGQSILSALFISFLCTPSLIRHSQKIQQQLQYFLR